MNYADLLKRADEFGDKVAQKWDTFTDNATLFFGKAKDEVATVLPYKGTPDAAVSTVPVVGAYENAGNNIVDPTEGYNTNDLYKEGGSVGDSFLFGGAFGGLTGILSGASAGIGGLVGTFAVPALISGGKAISYLGMRALGGALSASDDIWDFTIGGINKLLGNDEAAQSAFENNFGDKFREYVDSEYKGAAYQEDGFIKKAGDYAEVVGNALPVAGAALVGSIFGGGAPLALTALTAGLKTAGKSTKRASEATGELGAKEFGYGALAGGAETAANLATGYFLRNKLASKVVPSKTGEVKEFAEAVGKDTLSGYEGLGGTIETMAKVGDKLLKNSNLSGFSLAPGFASDPNAMTKLAGRIALQIFMPTVINTTSEALEGGVTAWLDPFFRKWTYDENAQNASIGDITKAALTDAGAAYVLGWIGFTDNDISFYNNDAAAYRKQAIEEGEAAKENADEIITEAEKVTELPGDYAGTEAIAEEVQKFKDSIAETGGKVETDDQKMLLGEIQKHTAARKIVPLVEDSAVSILQYPEAYVEKVKHLDMKDENGKPIEVTVDELTEGINYEGTEEELFASVQKALSKNKTLAMLAAADMADKVVQPDMEKLAWMQYGSGANEAQAAEMSAALGGATTYSSAKQAAKQYASTPEGQAKVASARNIEKKAKSAPPNNRPVPTVIGTALADGVYRYGGANGIAIVKENGVYYVYDYARGLISKPLTAMQVNAALARGRNQE